MASDDNPASKKKTASDDNPASKKRPARDDNPASKKKTASDDNPARKKKQANIKDYEKGKHNKPRSKRKRIHVYENDSELEAYDTPDESQDLSRSPPKRPRMEKTLVVPPLLHNPESCDINDLVSDDEDDDRVKAFKRYKRIMMTKPSDNPPAKVNIPDPEYLNDDENSKLSIMLMKLFIIPGNKAQVIRSITPPQASQRQVGIADLGIPPLERSRQHQPNLSLTVHERQVEKAQINQIISSKLPKHGFTNRDDLENAFLDPRFEEAASRHAQTLTVDEMGVALLDKYLGKVGKFVMIWMIKASDDHRYLPESFKEFLLSNIKSKTIDKLVEENAQRVAEGEEAVPIDEAKVLADIHATLYYHINNGRNRKRHLLTPFMVVS